MKNGIEITKHDLKSLNRDLHQDEERIARQTENALIDVAYDIDNGAKQRVPVRTGRLMNSIHVEHSGCGNYRYRDKNGNNFDGSLAWRPVSGEVMIGTNVEYAREVEETKKSYLWASWNANIGNLEAKIRKHVK